MKRLLSSVLCLVLLLGLTVPVRALAVMRSNQALEVDGKAVACECYNIDDKNYFRLRDLAALLKDTPDRFDVDYDPASRTVLLYKGRSYVPRPDDLTFGEDKSASAVLSNQSVKIDGRAVSLTAYNLGDNNYFQLRELGQALGFVVGYRTEDRTMTVSTAPQVKSGRLIETPDAGREYLDRIVFLGDSTTYAIGYYYGRGYKDLVPSSQIWTPKSGTLTLSYYATAKVVVGGQELLIADAAKQVQPDILVITLGVNGVSFMDKEWFIRDYTDLVQSIQAASPNTKIIINSIYPVADSYAHQKSINNKKIGDANIWLEGLAEDLGLPFLYCFEAVAVNGKLPENAHNGDGMHLTGESFGKVMAYIRTHAIED